MTIDAYLDELCSALTVDALRRDEIRLEAHAHLRAQADAYLRQGMAVEEAEKRAIAEFGMPQHLAEQLGQSRPVTPHTRRSPHLFAAGLLISALNVEWLFQMLSRFAWINGGIHVFPSGVLARYSDFAIDPLLWNVTITPLYLLLGIQLMRGKRVRIFALALTLFNPGLMLTLLGYFPNLLFDHLYQNHGRNVFPLRWYFSETLENGGFLLFLIGLYLLWVYTRPQRQLLLAD